LDVYYIYIYAFVYMHSVLQDHGKRFDRLPFDEQVSTVVLCQGSSAKELYFGRPLLQNSPISLQDHGKQFDRLPIDERVATVLFYILKPETLLQKSPILHERVSTDSPLYLKRLLGKIALIA